MTTLTLTLTVLVFVATLALILLRPGPFDEARAALLGGILMIAIGAVPARQAAWVLAGSWNVFLFFLGLMAISAIAEAAGFFDWIAAHAVRASGGSTRRLFLNVFAIGVLISTFLSNDATALVLTPIVFTLVTKLGVEPLPFMFACTFIADTASLTLPVSNPVNILMLDVFPQTLGAYLRHLLLPSLLAIAINVGFFVWLFRREVRGQVAHESMPAPDEAIPHRAFFRYVLVVLALVAIAYVAASARGWPLSFVALAGSAALLAGGLAWGRVTPRLLGREISWSLFPFIAGVLVVVQGVENAGLTARLGHLFLSLAGQHPLQAALAGAFGSALTCNLVNNVPTMMLLRSALRSLATATPAVQRALIYSTILGCDLGPNVTTIGSLATILWLLILQRKGLKVRPLDYFRIGIAVTPLMLLAGAIAIGIAASLG